MKNRLPNPYVGPRTYTEKESDLYFGREREARDLLSLVISNRLVLFYAQSGAGKSSLINTRLKPQLREEGFTVLPTGRVSGEIPPGITEIKNIYAFNLMANLDQSNSNPHRFIDLTLKDFLTGLTYQNDKFIYRALSPTQNPNADNQVRVLIIDQFEEIITNHPDRWEERALFFRQLDQAMRADPLLWIVLALREDYVASLDPYAPLLKDKLRIRFYMQRMTEKAALEAVQKPAQKHGRPFTQDAAKALVDNLRRIRIHGSPKPRLGQFIEPVQLQVVCYQLWENLNRKQQPATTIRMAELRTLGDVDTALGQFYEQALTKVIQLTKEREHTLRSWFNDELITEAGTRGIVYQGETKTGGIQNETVEQLANQYLLHAEMRAGGVWYELTHDRFVEPIKKSNDSWFAQRRERRLRIGGITGLIVMILLCAVISLWFSINLSVTTNAANAAESTAQAAKTLNALQASNAMLDTIKVQAIAATATTQWLNDDSDGDGLTNEEELQFGTDPTLADSDFDGVPDNEEISNLSDPTNRDSDNDGTPDAFDTDPVPGPTATPVVVTIGFSNPQPYLNQSFFSSQENRYQINEDEGAAIIQVELSESVDREIQMDYGVEITNAAENVDYRLNGSTLTFNPGDMLKTIEVEVIPNPQRTENALLVLALSNPPPGVNLGLDRIELVITSEQ